jgi:hypothetical protein
MKKYCAILASVLMLVALSTPALAEQQIPGSNGNPCNGLDCANLGGSVITATAAAGGVDCDAESIPNGFAGGISAGGGAAAAGAGGLVTEGDLGLSVSALAGGGAQTEAFRWQPLFDNAPDKVIGVKSISSAHGQVGGSVDVNVDPDGYYVLDAGGMAAGGFIGIGGQVTADISTLGTSPKHFEFSEGKTGGIAAQGSAGLVAGSAVAGSLGDTAYDREVTVYSGEPGDRGAGYYTKYGKYSGHNYGTNWYNSCPSGNLYNYDFQGSDKITTTERVVCEDSKAGASASANIFMSGGSYSASYRFVDVNGDKRTEGMGTFVGAETEVTSFAAEDAYADGRVFGMDTSYADSGFKGGFVAFGGAASRTTQVTDTGFAQATALGVYAGGGELGCDFSGSAVGYTHTTATQIAGYKGSIMSSSAGMQVTSSNSVTPR